MTTHGDAPELIAAIEAETERLRELLAGLDAATADTRPPNGTWSITEHVRHLLFAEQLHLGGLVEGREWSRMGLPPGGLQRQPRFQSVLDLAGTPALADVLAAWAEAHEAIRGLAREDSAKVRTALERNLGHLRTHVRIIERLSRRRGRPAGGVAE
jgi:hypothetical protein